jgi:hypothetical protein
MDKITSPNPLRLALLIIDVHKRGLRRLNADFNSAPERAVDFVNGVRETADALREKLGIPAYVVALDNFKRIYPDEISDPSQHNKEARKDLSRVRGLSGKNALNPRPDETIVSKKDNDVFMVDGFAEHLKQAGIDGVVIVGMDSEFCAAHSAFGAIQNDLHCIMLTNRLAQSWKNHEGINGGDPAWHEKAVRRGVDTETADKIIFAQSEDFIANPRKYLAVPEPENMRSQTKTPDVKAGFRRSL